MPLVEWTEELVVGVPAIDNAHHEFVDLLNALSTAPEARFRDLFARLMKHSREHFAEEERMMERSAFPIMEVHKAEHERVLKELEEVQSQLDEGEYEAAREYVREQLSAWFVLHRNTMDYVTAVHIQRTLG